MTQHLDLSRLMPGAQVYKTVEGIPVFVLKAQPTPGDVHVNTPLSNISIAFMQNASNFVASRVFPNIPVSKQSDRYYTYDRGFFNRSEMAKRAPGTETKGIGYAVDSTPSYFCDVWGIHHDIPDQVRANADAPINSDRDATHLVTHQALIRQEISWAAQYFVTSIWSFQRTGVDSSPVVGTSVLRWNDANSTPIEDVRLAKRTIAESTGFEPNKLVIGRAVYDVLADHPDIVDRIKYGGQSARDSGNPARVTIQAMKELFEVDDLLVMNAIQNTAAEGQTNAHSFIGGKHALLCYAAPTPGLMIPSAGYTFSWTGYLGASDNGGRVRRFRLEQLASDRVELELAFQQKQIAADLGFFFLTVVA